MGQRTIALVGDVVRSREIEERVAFDRTLLDTLNQLNERNPAILSPYTLIGDEVQAVFSSANALFNDAVTILSAIHPEKMRFSFGIGTLVTPINPDRATEMDGPAFHNARDGVNELKETGHLFNVTGESVSHLGLVKQTLFLVSHAMEKWNRNRLRSLAMLQRDQPVKAIAAELEISEVAVYKTINAGGLELLIRLFAELEALLDEDLRGSP